MAFTQVMVTLFLINDHFFPYKVITDRPLLLIIFATLLIAAAGYIINDYYDIKIDNVNKPSRVIIGRTLNRRVAIALHVFFSSVGIAIGLLLNKTILATFIVSVFFLWLYSNTLKRTPLIGNILVALLTAMAIWLPSEWYGHNRKVVFAFAVYAFFISLIRELIKDMEDIRGDARFGAKTLPVVWGIRKTKILVYAITAIFIASLFMVAGKLSQYLSIYFALLLAPISWLITKLVYADTKRKFAQLSLWFKLLMILGVLGMVFL